MAGLQIWRHVPGKVLLFLINLVAATALIFEGEWDAREYFFFFLSFFVSLPFSRVEASSRSLISLPWKILI